MIQSKWKREMRRIQGQLVWTFDVLLYNVAWLWKKWRQQTDGLVIYVALPVHYVMFVNIQKHLPDVRVVAANDKVAEYLAQQGINSTRSRLFPDVVIMADFFKKCYAVPWIKKIQIYHGVGCKNYFYKKSKRNDIYYLVAGSYVATRLQEMGCNNVNLVGYPKTDDFFNRSLNKEELLYTLGGDITKKTVLYTPTWGNPSSAPYLAKFINKISNKYNVIVKLHDHSLDEWRILYKNMPDVMYVENADATKYQYAADILISDFSSTIFEFAQLYKPIIVYGVSDDYLSQYAADPGLWKIARRVFSETELGDTLSQLLEGDWEPDGNYIKTVDELFMYRDGRSAHRAVEVIKNIINRLN